MKSGNRNILVNSPSGNQNLRRCVSTYLPIYVNTMEITILPKTKMIIPVFSDTI